MGIEFIDMVPSGYSPSHARDEEKYEEDRTPPFSIAASAPGDKYAHDPHRGDRPDLERMAEEHEKLIDMILDEEDGLIDSHKKHIDAVMELSKKELSLINDVSKPGSEIIDYVKGLDTLLQHKAEIIGSLRSRLQNFSGHLKQEEDLSHRFNELQQQQQPQQFPAAPQPWEAPKPNAEPAIKPSEQPQQPRGAEPEIDLLRDDVKMDGF